MEIKTNQYRIYCTTTNLKHAAPRLLMSAIILFNILLYFKCILAQQNDESSQQNNASNDYLILGLFSILTGFFFLFLGFKWKGLTSFISTFGIFGLIAYVILWNIWPTGSQIIYIIVTIIFGVSGGFVGYFAKPFGRAAIGAVSGVSLSMWIFSFRPSVFIQKEVIVNALLSCITLLNAFLAYYKEIPDDKYPIIISSCISGSFAIVCGMDLFINVGMGETFFAVIRGIYDNLPEQGVDWKLGFMLVSTCILCIIGISTQTINHKGVDIQSILPTKTTLDEEEGNIG